MPAEKNVYTGQRFGRQRCGGGVYSRHRHSFGYICVVLSGRFIEAGDVGRFRLGPGDVLVHRRFEAHMDVFDTSAADVLNLPLVAGLPQAGLLRCSDVDAVAIHAESNPLYAAQLLARTSHVAIGEQDWPDALAQALDRNEVPMISLWAETHGLRASSVSRGFAKAYGVSPQRFRADRRACKAVQALGRGEHPLASLAVELGFSDQAHMTREVARLTGSPPGQWRSAQENCVQEDVRSGC